VISVNLTVRKESMNLLLIAQVIRVPRYIKIIFYFFYNTAILNEVPNPLQLERSLFPKF
jgi:hypothetical protein